MRGSAWSTIPGPLEVTENDCGRRDGRVAGRA